MKILYGVQTTGNGHLVRARNMIAGLRQLGHQIHTLLSGDTKKNNWDLEFFEPYTLRRGLTFCAHKGKLDYIKTIGQLNLFRFYLDCLSFDADSFDLVITDFEPISARIAKYKKIPSIGLGHLYAFCYQVPVFKRYSPSLMVMKKFAPVDVPLGLHWHHFGEPVLPPTIPRDVQNCTVKEQDKILVYLPFESLDQVKAFLFQFSNRVFCVYSQIPRSYEEKNLRMRPLNREGFLKDLAESQGVICNAGFSLLSEALHLGKKVLVKPVSAQIEQESNALALENLGWGTVMRSLDPQCLSNWIQQIHQPSRAYPDVISEVVNWIHRENWNNLQALSDKLWNSSAGSNL